MGSMRYGHREQRTVISKYGHAHGKATYPLSSIAVVLHEVPQPMWVFKLPLRKGMQGIQLREQREVEPVLGLIVLFMRRYLVCRTVLLLDLPVLLLLFVLMLLPVMWRLRNRLSKVLCILRRCLGERSLRYGFAILPDALPPIRGIRKRCWLSRVLAGRCGGGSTPSGFAAGSRRRYCLRIPDCQVSNLPKEQRVNPLPPTPRTNKIAAYVIFLSCVRVYKSRCMTRGMYRPVPRARSSSMSYPTVRTSAIATRSRPPRGVHKEKDREKGRKKTRTEMETSGICRSCAKM